MKNTISTFLQKLVAAILLGILLISCSTKSEEVKLGVISDVKAKLGEGAIWDNENQYLLWIDIEGMLLHIYNPSENTTKSIQLPERVGTVVPLKNKDVLLALETGIFKLNTESEELVKVADPEPQKPDNRFNDGKCDSEGRLWAGTFSMKVTKDAALYRINNDYSSDHVIDSVSISNGIAWSLENDKMYYIDTPTKKVMEYQFNSATGAISNPRVAIEIPDTLGSPDGSTLDAEGKLWIAMWGGHCITRWDPETGALLEKIDVPSLNTTSLAFGGENLDILFITSASLYMPEEEAGNYPDGGKLYVIKPGVKGIPSNPFIEK